MAEQSLQDVLESTASITDLLRSNTGRHPYPVPDEHTNWIEEQQSWRETCSLSDLSHHQRDLYVSGPDVLEVLSALGVNDFDGFEVGQAKQFVACNTNGYLIGDAILFYLDADTVKLTGTPVASNWVEYNVETGSYDVDTHADERYLDKDEPHDTFRYQLQGPNALDVMEGAVDGDLPSIGFFNFDDVTINGHTVQALGHSMSADPGFEIWGDWEIRHDVRDRILEVGESHGIRQLGEKSYKAQGPEKGWVPRPLPAIFGEEMRAYREWLDADCYEITSQLGGSYAPDDISDYYLEPIELGYERFIDFDHDFVGKEALQDMVANPRRKRVTLVWDTEDVLDIYRSFLTDGESYKYLDMDSPWWSVFHYDDVRHDDETVGVSKYFGYTYNERSVLSLALVDIEHSEPGTELSLVWGEPGGTSPSPKVEDHVQTDITVTTAPAPYVEQ